jgi:WD40 repeat protein
MKDRPSDDVVSGLREAAHEAALERTLRVRASSRSDAVEPSDPPSPSSETATPIDDPDEKLTWRLGEFRVLRELGRGGMGVVYLAEQESLGRQVALKILSTHASFDPDQQKRFQREGRSAARLHHTNIVPVFGVGRQDGVNYIVMQYISGIGLDKLLRELQRYRGELPAEETPTDCFAAPPPPPPDTDEFSVSTSKVLKSLWSGFRASREPSPETAADSSTIHQPVIPPQKAVSTTPSGRNGDAASTFTAAPPASYFLSVAHIGVQVADALAYAHAENVLHRDIKPSNLLIDADGRAWVADFGLAKAMNDSDNVTASGDLVGTVRYMAPERFTGRTDGRSDIFSLGLTLYELLALKPACDIVERSQLLRQMVDGNHVARAKMLPGVPRDLETIVLKAMAPEPHQRYQTAAELSEDLNRFLNDRPIRARRIGLIERGLRWRRRHPGMAALAGILAAVVAVSFVVVSSLYWSASAAWHDEADARTKAERNLYYSRIAQARLEWEANRLASAEAILDQCSPEQRDGWEWRYLKRLCRADVGGSMAHDSWAWRVAFSPDGKWIASAGGGDPFYRNPGHRSKPGDVRIWALDPIGAGVPRLHQTLKGHDHLVTAVAFHPATPANGAACRVASGSHDGTVRLWDASSGRELWKADMQSTEVRALTFSPDGKTLLAGQGFGVSVLDAETGGKLRSLAENLEDVRTIAVSPDRRTAAIVSFGHAIHLCDLETGKLGERLPHSEQARAVDFSPDGLRLAATYHDGVAVLDARTLQMQRHLTVERGRVLAAAFSPDGQYVATGGTDAVVRLWSLASAKEVATFRGHRQDVLSLAFSPDGAQLVSSSQDETVKLWDLTSNAESQYIGRGPDLQNLAWRQEGKELAYVGVAGLTVVDARNGNALREHAVDLMRRWSSPCSRGAFDVKQGRIATVSARDEGMVTIADADGENEFARLGKHAGLIRHLAFSADGRRLVSASVGSAKPQAPAQVKVWDSSSRTPSEKPIFEWQQDGVNVGSVALSPDGGLLVFAEMQSIADEGTLPRASVRRVDLSGPGAPRELPAFEMPAELTAALCFSSDGQRLAAATFSSSVFLWDLTTGHKLSTRAAVRAPAGLDFSPDGSRLAVAGRDFVALLDARTGLEVLTLRPPIATEGDPGSNPRVRFSPDGDRLAAIIGLNVVSLWDARPLAAVSAPADGTARAERAFVWHLDRFHQSLELADKIERAFAVAFHRKRLDELQPPTPLLEQQRTRAYAQIDQR